MKNLLTRNSKIAKMSGAYTVNWTLPAVRTCPQASTCKVGCYATQGAYAWTPSQRAHKRNFQLSKQDNFAQVISEELSRRKKIKRVRIHDAGDFYNEGYLLKWLYIIRAFPQIEFYAYTKMVALFKSLAQKQCLPSNLTTIYSYGGKQDHLINPSIDRHSAVFSSLEDLLAAGYSDASKDDSVATGVNHKIGLVYHGAKSKQWGIAV